MVAPEKERRPVGSPALLRVVDGAQRPRGPDRLTRSAAAAGGIPEYASLQPSHTAATMSKRKEPEDERAPAAVGAPPPPPRLGDPSSSMAEPLLPLADVRIKVQGGILLPAHASTLVQNCGALARSSELFADATSKAPSALSAPFDECAEADVARFLKCIYTSVGAALPAADAARPAVVRLAHALDAAPVLAAARRAFVELVQSGATVLEIAEAAELAALCGWEDVRAETEAVLVDGLQTPLGAAATPAQQVLSDVNAFDFARDLIDSCAPALAKRVVGTLAANFRRLHAKASAGARASALDPPAVAAAVLASVNKVALEVDGRFAASMDVPDFNDERPGFWAPFKSHGLEWSLILMPNGSQGNTDGRPCVGLELRSGWPKKVKSATSLIDPSTEENTNPKTNQPTTHCSRLASNSLEGALPARAREFRAGAAMGEPRRRDRVHRVVSLHI